MYTQRTHSPFGIGNWGIKKHFKKVNFINLANDHNIHS